MVDLLKDCYNCFLLSLIEKHLNEPISYYNFSFFYWEKFLKLIKFITKSYLLLLNLLLFLSTFFCHPFSDGFFFFFFFWWFSDCFQMACLEVSAKLIFSVNQLYYMILQSFFCIQHFFRVQVFMVQVFLGPSFSGTKSRHHYTIIK